MKLRNPALVLAIVLLLAALVGCSPIQVTAAPTAAPTSSPTAAPTVAPTEAPTATPTEEPTPAPTEAPTEAPTQAPDSPFSLGSFDGANYSNSYFGLTFTIPDNWVVATKEEMAQAFQLGAEFMNLDEKDLSNRQSVYLAYVMRYPYGSAVSFNQNMNANCVNLGLAGMLTIDSKKIVEETVKAILQSTADSGLGYSFGDVTAVTVNGTEYATVDGSLAYAGLDIKQRLLCAKRGTYAIVFTLSWVEADQLAELEGIVNTIVFK